MSYLPCYYSSVSGSLAASYDSGDLGGSSSSLVAIYFRVRVKEDCGDVKKNMKEHVVEGKLVLLLHHL